ncbi:MAG: hypothetical protein HXS54_01355 [Theionarchaea archaeon]|nr:hypothetical protein [Theionarchaea archaeon]
MSDLAWLLNPNLEGREWTHSAAQQWLSDHEIEFRSLLEDEYSFYSLKDAKRKLFDEDPFLGVQKTMNFITPNDTKIEILKEIINSFEFGDIIFIGYYQTGKTAMMFRFAKWLKEDGRKIAWFGPPRDLPDWVDDTTMDPLSIPTGWVIIYDEASVREFCRNAMTKENRRTFENYGTKSHQSQLWLKATQTARQTDVMNVLLPRMFVIKTMTPEQVEMEREIIKDLTDWIPFTPDKSLTYIKNLYIPRVQFTARIPLLTEWKPEYSKLFKKFETREEIEKYVRDLFAILQNQEDCLQRIQIELRRMRVEKSQDEICQIVGIQR